MRRKSTMKIARGRLEEDRRKSEDVFEYQRVMLFVLPLLMVAVLVVGVYFGYLSYTDDFVDTKEFEQSSVSDPQFTDGENKELLRVVSSATPVGEDYVPQLSTVNGVEVNTLMAQDLELMLLDAQSSGLNLTLVSGYISYEEQKEKYNNAVAKHKKLNKSSTVKAEAAVKKTIPNAGECEQQTGLLVKLSDGSDKKFSDTPEFDWLQKNCVNYGFVLRYPDKENTGGLAYSSDLYRYVGREYALSMRTYNLNMDEFVRYLAYQ